MEEDRLINRLGMSGLGHGVAVYRGATFENLSFNTFTYQFNNAFGLDTKIVFEDERSRREISPADGLSVFQHVANIITKVQRTALLPEPDVLLLSQEFEDQSDAEKPIPFLGVLVGGANNAMGCLYHVDWPNKTCFEKRMEYTNFVFLPALRVSINKNKKKDYELNATVYIRKIFLCTKPYASEKHDDHFHDYFYPYVCEVPFNIFPKTEKSDSNQCYICNRSHSLKETDFGFLICEACKGSLANIYSRKAIHSVIKEANEPELMILHFQLDLLFVLGYLQAILWKYRHEITRIVKWYFAVGDLKKAAEQGENLEIRRHVIKAKERKTGKISNRLTMRMLADIYASICYSNDNSFLLWEYASEIPDRLGYPKGELERKRYNEAINRLMIISALEVEGYQDILKRELDATEEIHFIRPEGAVINTAGKIIRKMTNGKKGNWEAVTVEGSKQVVREYGKSK